jgi:hypothetical protein
MGKPTVTIATNYFVPLAKNSAESLGMPGLPLVVVPHPLGGIPYEEVKKKARSAVQEIVERATRVQQTAEAEKKEKTDLLTIRGTLHDVNSTFYSNGWTDGLPVLPPTGDAVREMLKGTDLPPDHILGIMPPKSGRVTVEKVAINAVMAGCRPTYMPVLIAAVEGILEKDFDLAGVQTSTGPHSPMLIINGPIRQQIRVNYGAGALGPGWQSNASIGRAIRLILNNVGGAKLGITDMTTLGMAENFTYCFGENEEKNPWEPFHVEQGFTKEDSTVSVLGAYSPEQVSDHVGIEPKEILTVAADVIARLTRFHLLAIGPIIPRDSVLVLCPEHAESIAKAGWSKKDVQRFLFENSKMPYEKLRALRRQVEPSQIVSSPDGAVVPMFLSPEKIKIVVAGGSGKHSAYMNTGHSKRIITKKVVFPKNWDELLDRYRE